LFQIGAELVGDDSMDADGAMLKLASELVRAFNGKPTIVYNDVSVAAALGASARDALVTKRADAVAPPLIRKLIAGDATIDAVQPFAPKDAGRLDALRSALDPDEFVLHLDDVEEGAGYYTGLRFRVYGKTLIAQGGRYDNLYARFGAAAPAIGFTFTI